MTKTETATVGPRQRTVANSSGAGWTLTLWPGAREAGGSFRYSRNSDTAPTGDGSPPDPDRSRAEAARRARATVRRYAAANGCNRLGTLTYAGTGCSDPLELRMDVGDFFRDLRAGLGGKPLPYVWTAERHKVHDDGTWHGLHVHFAAGRYIPRKLIEQAWGRGFVHIKLLGDLPVGSGRVEEARVAARYLSKYIGKAFEAERLPGLHRYEVAQGFQPVRERLTGRSATEVLGKASERMRTSPAVVWSSSTATDWHGPPSVWASWRG